MRVWLSNGIAEAFNRERQQANARQAVLAEEQRQQRMFEEARRQQAEQQRQQEIAQARIDAQSGDPLVGNWKSQNISLRITRNGSLYLVHVDNGFAGGGDYAGPYKDDQILLGGAVGNVAVLSGKTQLVFSGTMFTKAGQ